MVYSSVMVLEIQIDDLAFLFIDGECDPPIP